MAYRVQSLCETCGVYHAPATTHKFIYFESEKLDSEYMCPISLEPLYDAVVAPCMHTFERVGIIRCLAASKTCPICRRAMTVAELQSVPFMVKSLLDKLKVFYNYITLQHEPTLK